MSADLEPELEAELQELIHDLSEGELESEAEWEAAGVPVCPRPTSSTVGGFPRYAPGITSLPLREQQKIQQLAGAIRSSFRPGCSPVLQVDLIGHADRDFQRGPVFEHRISMQRALAVQRALQQRIADQTIATHIAWQARGAGARDLLVKSPRNESERSRNRRVDVKLSHYVSADYPVLVKEPGAGYTWTTRSSVSALPAVREAEAHLTFPDPTGVSNSLQTPYRWICSLVVDFGPEVLHGVVTGKRILASGTGTLISTRHVLTAGHVLLTQGPPEKDIFGTEIHPSSPALSVTVIPGRDGGKTPPVEPQGRRNAMKTRVSPAWRDSNSTNRAFDYGLITLEQPLPADYGFWSGTGSQILPLSDSGIKDKVARCSGYPGKFCPPPDPNGTVRCSAANQGTVQFQMSGDVTGVFPELLETQMKIAEGHSGSPTWIPNSSGAPNLVGIASASRVQVPEIAVRIRSALLDKIRAWMREDGVRPTF